MCDYSLMGVPSRLAREGEELIVHTFPTGSKGMTSPDELAPSQKKTNWALWERLKSMFIDPEQKAIGAVCIPPGARLILRDIPPDIQISIDVHPVESVTFTQFDMTENRHRDAIRFGNGCEISLQCLVNGQRVTVVDLDFDVPSDLPQDKYGQVMRF